MSQENKQKPCRLRVFYYFFEETIYFGIKPALGVAVVLVGFKLPEGVKLFLKKSLCFLLGQMHQNIKGVMLSLSEVMSVVIQ